MYQFHLCYLLKTSLTILFSLLTFSLFAQNYTPLLGNTNWENKWYDFSAEGCWDYGLDSPEPLDTLLGIGYAQRVDGVTGDYLLWEDTLTQQVWYFKENSGMTAPSIIYDFSLVVGDNINITTPDNQVHNLEVTTVGTYFSPTAPGFTAKTITLSSPTGIACLFEVTWIEGLGCTTELLYPRLYCDPAIYLNKVLKDNLLVYDAAYECDPTPDCTTPTNTYEDMVTSTSAKLNWTGIIDAWGQIYTLRWRMVGTPGWNNGDFGYYPYYNYCNLLGLSPNTLYEWQVRKSCGYGVYTDFTTLRQFSTAPVGVSAISQDDLSLWYHSGKVHIERTQNTPVDFLLYNINGQLLKRQADIGNNAAIDIALPAGVYIGIIQGNSANQYVRKVVVP